MATSHRFGTRDELLNTAEQAFSGVLKDPIALTPLVQRSYNETRLQELLTLVEKGRHESRNYDAARKEEFEASEAYKLIKEEEGEDYRDDVSLARTALKHHPEYLLQLGLHGERQYKLSAHLEQRSQLYDGALREEAIQTLLSPVGLTREALIAGRDGTAAIRTAYETFQRERREAFDARESRDEVLDKIADELGTFVDICRVVYKNNPKILEQLGIF